MTRRDERGFSYLEIMISLIIIGVVIVPVGNAIVNATKTQIKAKTVYQATKGAEAMMEAIRFKLDELIEERLEHATLESSKRSDKLFKETNLLRALDLMGPRLEETTVEEAEQAFRRENNRFQITGIEDRGLSYEVAIWAIGDLKNKQQISFSNVDIGEDKLYLKDAYFKLYSDAPTYQLEGEDLKTEVGNFDLGTWDRPMQFEVSEVVEAVGYDSEAGRERFEFSDTIPVLEITQEGKVIERAYKGNQSVNGMTIEKVNKSKVPTYVINQSEGKNAEELMLYIDARALEKMSEIPQVVRIINQTAQPVVIRVVQTRSILESKEEYIQVLIDSSKAGKTVLESVNSFGAIEDYVIGLIVRDKAQQGKIVKKMIDVYTYNPS